MKTQVLLSLILLLGFGTSVKAQTQEAPPNEAPYVDELNEFEEALPDKDKKEKDAGARIENEMNIQDDFADKGSAIPIEQSAPEIAKPTHKSEEPPIYQRADSDENKVQRKSAKGGIEYIQHPQSAKGLVKIEKDGTYIYKTTAMQRKEPISATLRFGSISPPAIKSSDGTTDFSSMYSSGSVPIVMFDYEWQPLREFGKLGVVAGFGVMTATGSGHFIDGSQAQEKYTFVAFPLSIGGIYRLEYFNKQWLAPYVSAGGTYVAVAEFRDDGKGPNATGAPGGYGAGGLMFSISAMDRETAFNLSSEYGISNLWISAEYRYLKTFNDAINFSSSIMNVGIAVDY